jgi:hypothetical protein
MPPDPKRTIRKRRKIDEIRRAELVEADMLQSGWELGKEKRASSLEGG